MAQTLRSRPSDGSKGPSPSATQAMTPSTNTNRIRRRMSLKVSNPRSKRTRKGAAVLSVPTAKAGTVTASKARIVFISSPFTIDAGESQPDAISIRLLRSTSSADRSKNKS